MWQDLEQDLRRRFNVIDEPVHVGETVYSMVHPKSADDLICDAEFELDERLPYWAEIWPSARMLAARIAGEDGRGKRFLELGCGSGLVTAVAARAGYETTATDYYSEALEFTRLNACRNSVPPPVVRCVDWRRPPDDLGTFDLVAAADVLYERGYTALIAAAFRRWLAPGGLGLLADPRRRNAVTFREECTRASLAIRSIQELRYEQSNPPVTIDLFELE